MTSLRGARAVLVAALAAGGCVPTHDLALGPPAEARSALVVILGGPPAIPRLSAFGVDLANGARLDRSVALGAGDRVLALYYRESFGELGLDPDHLQLELGNADPAGRSSRALPSPSTWFVAELEDGALTWRTGLELPPLRLPVVDVVACANRGGCLLEVDATLCTIPCPEPDPVVEPIAPEPPRLTLVDCPDGHQGVVGTDGTPICEPPPTTALCAPGSLWPRGATGCERIGRACPSGQWPEELPAATRVAFVSPGGTGTGTADAPLGSIRSALARGAGTLIVLARGTYREDGLILAPGIWLVGACTEEVVIASSGLVLAPTGGAGTATVSDLRLEGGLGAIGVTGAGSTLVLARVEATTSTGAAVRVDSGHLRAESLRIRGGDTGLYVFGGTAALERTVVEGSVRHGISGSGATLTLTDVAVRDLGATAGARGIALARGGFEADGLEVTHVAGPGLLFDGVRARLSRLLVRDTQGAKLGGGALTMRDALIARTVGTALRLDHRYLPEVEGLVIRGTTRLDDSVGSGDALVATSYADVHASKLLIEGSVGWAASTQAFGVLRLEDGVLRGAVGAEDPPSSGLVLGRASDVSATRLRLEPRARFGVFADPLSHLVLRDVSVLGVPSAGAPTPSAAIHVEGSSCSAVRVEVSDAAGPAVELFGSTEDQRVELADLAVRRSAGEGVHLSATATPAIDRLLIEDATGVGLSLQPSLPPGVFTAGSRVVLREVSVRRTRADAALDCAGECTSGIGVLVGSMLPMKLKSFAITDSEAEGLHVDLDPLALDRGVVSGSPIGLRVLDDTLELQPLLRRVALKSNGTNFTTR